ncbi:MAG: prepilin-type N-terminal cleavage/methylation domain-containing protein [Planctomycetota bacterium]
MHNRSRTRSGSRSGFTLLELAAVVAAGSIALAQAMPMAKRARGNARGMGSAANLMTIGQGAGMYGLDNEDRIFSFTWAGAEPGATSAPRFTLPSGQLIRAVTDIDAASAQQTEIIQRGTGRFTENDEVFYTDSRLPHRRTIGLVLLDYLGLEPGDSLLIDPNDANQLRWAANPRDIGPGSGVPYADGVPGDGFDDDGGWTQEEIRQRWAYSSSYQTTVDAWQPQGLFQQNNVYVPFSNTPHLFVIRQQDFSREDVELSDGRRLTDVAFPSAKVYFHEEFDREQSGDPYFAYDHARPEKLMFDGSTNTNASGEAGSSISLGTLFEDLKPRWMQPYVPLDGFPLPLGGLFDEQELDMRYRWTFQGLRGTDYATPIMRRGRSGR